LSIKAQDLFLVECLMATMQAPDTSSLENPSSPVRSEPPTNANHCPPEMSTGDITIKVSSQDTPNPPRRHPSSGTQEVEEIAATPPLKKINSIFE
jgi:hypothetical protein